MSLACPACGASTEPVRRDLAGASGEVTVVVEGAPAAVCAEGHETAAPDLATRLVAAVGDLLPAARRGRPFGDDRCGACGEPLTMPARRSSRSISPTVQDEVLTMTFDLPMVRCASCGTDQAPYRTGTRAALAALRDALTS